jgi:hypothetical protein
VEGVSADVTVTLMTYNWKIVTCAKTTHLMEILWRRAIDRMTRYLAIDISVRLYPTGDIFDRYLTREMPIAFCSVADTGGACCGNVIISK